MKRFIHIFIVNILFVSCHSTKNVGVPIVDELVLDKPNTFYPGEVKPVKSLPCFQGAYYRKAVSSKDHWIGIKGEVILPGLDFDSNRMNPAKPQQFLDVSSIYLGGNMDEQETDIGLAWEIIRDEKGIVSQERLAFRPFLRRTAHKSGQQSVYINAPAVKDFYWYPGNKVTMSVEVVEDGQLLFIVEGEGKKYETLFACAGYSKNGKGDFKRVNAIDQVGNEGKAVQPTQTSVNKAKWNYTTLTRMQDGKKIDVPMHEGRFTSMICPDTKFFRLVQSENDKANGGETITIDGNP